MSNVSTLSQPLIPVNTSVDAKVNGGTYTYTVTGPPQGQAMSVTISVPGAPQASSWSVTGAWTGSMQGSNSFGPLYFTAGSSLTVTGSSVSDPGPLQVTGVQGPLGSLQPSTPTSVGPSVEVAAGTVDANIQNATIDVTGSTVTLGPGPVSYVAIPNPSAGADWAYVLPQTLRLTSVRATLTTSATVAARNPELWQVVNGDTVPTQETILSYDSVLPSWTLVFSSSPGASPNYRAQIGARPFGPGNVGTTGITLVTVAANQYFTAPTLYAMQSGGTAAITLYVDLNGFNLGTVELGINGSAELPLPDLIAGDTITAFTSAGSAVVTVEGGLVNDDRRVSSFSGLLMPAGSLIESATGNLQPGDQWSDIQLAFTEH